MQEIKQCQGLPMDASVECGHCIIVFISGIEGADITLGNVTTVRQQAALYEVVRSDKQEKNNKKITEKII